jgi:hypothetical protein
MSPGGPSGIAMKRKKQTLCEHQERRSRAPRERPRMPGTVSDGSCADAVRQEKQTHFGRCSSADSGKQSALRDILIRENKPTLCSKDLGSGRECKASSKPTMRKCRNEPTAASGATVQSAARRNLEWCRHRRGEFAKTNPLNRGKSSIFSAGRFASKRLSDQVIHSSDIPETASCS